jgi:hypothetical protein
MTEIFKLKIAEVSFIIIKLSQISKIILGLEA